MTNTHEFSRPSVTPRASDGCGSFEENAKQDKRRYLRKIQRDEALADVDDVYSGRKQNM